MASATPDGFPARPLVFFGLRAGAGAATDSSLARILALRRGCCGAGGGDGVGGGGGCDGGLEMQTMKTLGNTVTEPRGPRYLYSKELLWRSLIPLIVLVLKSIVGVDIRYSVELIQALIL
jgi:hypothetical protein